MLLFSTFIIAMSPIMQCYDKYETSSTEHFPTKVIGENLRLLLNFALTQ